MRTQEDRLRQAQCEIDTALAKRNTAKRLLQEAEEELIMARLKIADIQEKKK